MTYCPDMSKAFYSFYNSDKDSEQLTRDLENITVMDRSEAEAHKDDPTKEFVLKERTYDGYKLLRLNSAYFSKWRYTPTVDVAIKDKEEGTGSILFYKLDMEKTAFSFITVLGITILFMIGVIWLACATCVSFDAIGIVISLLLIVGPSYIAYRKIGIPLKKAAEVLGKIV